MGTSAASVLSPVRGLCRRTSPVRAVCSTRPSGSTARVIGSPGRSLRVTFWNREAGEGAGAAWSWPGWAAAAVGMAASPPTASSEHVRVATALRWKLLLGDEDRGEAGGDRAGGLPGGDREQRTRIG